MSQVENQSAPQILNEEDARWPYMAGDMDPQWFHSVHETANRYQLWQPYFEAVNWTICQLQNNVENQFEPFLTRRNASKRN